MIKKLKAVFFDLDGTLLPMNQEQFVKKYFETFSDKLSKHGYEPHELVKAVWSGYEAMKHNDGTELNIDVFWRKLFEVYGDKVISDKAYFDDYYANDFEGVRNTCGHNPEANAAVKAVKSMGLGLVLATNPLFPYAATHARMRWAGLDKEDFEIVTTYDNSRFCKPNTSYYVDLLDKMQLSAKDVLMVGNDVREDMVAEDTGMNVFLVTDDILNKDGKDISAYPKGSLVELIEFINKRFS